MGVVADLLDGRRTQPPRPLSRLRYKRPPTRRKGVCQAGFTTQTCSDRIADVQAADAAYQQALNGAGTDTPQETSQIAKVRTARAPHGVSQPTLRRRRVSHNPAPAPIVNTTRTRTMIASRWLPLDASGIVPAVPPGGFGLGALAFGALGIAVGGGVSTM
jgi:hypothetical protein